MMFLKLVSMWLVLWMLGAPAWPVAALAGHPAEPSAETAVPKLSPEALEAMLSGLETRLRQSQKDYALASAYRARCATCGQHDRAIKFFQDLLAADPHNARARLELGCAFVDKIPTCSGVAAIVSRGALARKSLDQFDAYLAAEPNSWVGHYARGMNHLHWPRVLRHSADAAQDLARCIELQARSGLPAGQPYYLRTHIALGDALAKDQEFAKARQAWRHGLKIFPEAKPLLERLAIAEDKRLLDFVENQRSLERPVDTDLSFLDR